MIAEKDPYIKSAYGQLQVISQDKQKRLEYEAREKAIRDHNQFIFEAKQSGREEGRKEGREEGREEGIEEGMKKGMVYAYYEMNMNTNEIAKKVQLTEAEVLEIIRKKDLR